MVERSSTGESLNRGISHFFRKIPDYVPDPFGNFLVDRGQGQAMTNWENPLDDQNLETA